MILKLEQRAACRDWFYAKTTGSPVRFDEALQKALQK